MSGAVVAASVDNSLMPPFSSSSCFSNPLLCKVEEYVSSKTYQWKTNPPPQEQIKKKKTKKLTLLNSPVDPEFPPSCPTPKVLIYLLLATNQHLGQQPVCLVPRCLNLGRHGWSQDLSESMYEVLSDNFIVMRLDLSPKVLVSCTGPQKYAYLSLDLAWCPVKHTPSEQCLWHILCEVFCQ